VTDPMLRLLANLPKAEPDRARAARVRSVCHAALARQRPPAPRPRRPVGTWEPVVAGLGALYLTETVWLALHLSGML
jgi:hypothetical protein